MSADTTIVFFGHRLTAVKMSKEERYMLYIEHIKDEMVTSVETEKSTISAPVLDMKTIVKDIDHYAFGFNYVIPDSLPPDQPAHQPSKTSIITKIWHGAVLALYFVLVFVAAMILSVCWFVDMALNTMLERAKTGMQTMGIFEENTKQD